MKNFPALILACLLCLASTALAQTREIEPVALPPAPGRVIATAFSPDSRSVAVARSVASDDGTQLGLTLQIMDLASAEETQRSKVPHIEFPGQAFQRHFLFFSADGKRLLYASAGSDQLTLIDAATLLIVRQFALKPAPQHAAPREGFHGISSVSVAAQGDTFAILRHDEGGEDEVFTGSFTSGEIVKSWTLGRLRIATPLGETSLALAPDGKQVAVSVLPDQTRIPKNFQNLRLYDANGGTLLKAMRTRGPIGPLTLLGNGNVLATRLDEPGFFSRSNCIEEWNLNKAVLEGRYCPVKLNAVALDAAPAAGRVAGYVGRWHKASDGEYYLRHGRVQVWNLRDRKVLANRGSFRGRGLVKISPDGKWILAEQVLLQVEDGSQVFSRTKH